MRILLILVVVTLTSCVSTKKKHKKYAVKKGIITYALKYPLTTDLITQKVYFTNYGATEYIESHSTTNTPTFPILKKDSLEYVFVTDSIYIENERGTDFIFEKLTTSQLPQNDLTLIKKSDTIIHHKKCNLFDFKFHKTNQKGKVALWKGIPLWVSSKLEEGLSENLTLIELDLKSEIPIEKTKVGNSINPE